MALTLDPATRVFTALQADLTFISGTLYELDTNAFRKEAMDLLASEDYIWMPDCYDHNAEYTILGVTYFRKVEWINGYSLQLEDTGSAYSVSFTGSNNNLFDIETGVLIPTPLVSAVGNNSAGNQTIISGSGLSATEATQLLEVWRLLGLEAGNKITITPAGVDDDSATIDINFTGDGISSTVMERQP